MIAAGLARRQPVYLLVLLAFVAPVATPPLAGAVTPDRVLAGLRGFYARTERADGSFANGIDPQYRGMSDSAYSDLAAVTYAVTLHKTFGWKLPFEQRTIEFLLARQKPSGDFFNVAGTVDPASAEGRVYNTTQGLVALHALGRQPRYRPLAVFDEILRAARWVLSCRNADGGFGHFPGSPSDADANYFQVGVLVMSGFLKPVDPLPRDARLLSWGHLMPLP